jgi:signal transduction histidine kinase
VPIVLASITVALSVALLVGWVFVSQPSGAWSGALSKYVVLLLWGTLSLGVIITVLVLFCVSLVKGMLEARRQDSFIDSVTHELNSPLASIKLCLETLGRKGLSVEQHERLRAMMLADVDRLHVFIGDILHATRVMHGENHGHDVSEINTVTFLQDMVHTLVERYHLSEGAVVCEIQEGVFLYTDTTALETIVRNLLDNAVKYSAEGCVQICVKAYVRDKTWVLEVHDKGMGMSSAVLKRVFERFYRADEPHVRMKRGTGLGLYVVSSLVKNIGGRVKAFSDGPGCGTCMQVTLPMHTQHRTGA